MGANIYAQYKIEINFYKDFIKKIPFNKLLIVIKLFAYAYSFIWTASKAFFLLTLLILAPSAGCRYGNSCWFSI